MRSFPILLALLFVPCLPLGTAAADDQPAPAPAPAPAEPTAEPLAKVPEFALKDVIADDGAYPKGWKSVTASGVLPAGAPSVKALLAIAQAAGVDTQKFDARCRPMELPGEGKPTATGVAAWVGVDEKSTAFTEALAKVTAAGGWTVKEIGGPMRVAVVWGSSKDATDAIMAWEVEVAVRKLCDLAVETVKSAGQQFDQAQAKAVFQKGMQLFEEAGRTEPEAGVYHLYKGRASEQLAMQAGQRGSREGFDKHSADAILHYRKALKKGAPVPPTASHDRFIVAAAFNAGQGLLILQDKSVLEEALSILLRGVAAEAHSQSHMHRFGNRYNLACAYARLAKLDDAFTHLEESLRYMKAAWEKDKKNSFSGVSQLGYGRHYEHALNVDEDLAPLRKDERWTPLMEKYDPNAKPKPEPTPEPKPEPKKDEPKQPEEKPEEKKDGG